MSSFLELNHCTGIGTGNGIASARYCVRSSQGYTTYLLGLADTASYERIVHRIQRITGDKEWALTKRLLGWMTCAARPLRWHEMQCAVSMDFDAEEGVINFDNDRRLRKHMQDTCGALVTVVDDRICLVHSTARQFIAESKHIDTPKVECEMASLCMQYLSLDCFGVNNSEGDLRYYILNGHLAFADYAVAKWVHHVHRFMDLIRTLAADDHWATRAVAIQEVYDAAQEFTNMYAEDLQASQARAACQQPELQISLTARDLLSDFEDAEPCLELLWMHLESYRHGDANARNAISLEQLRRAMEQFRTALEDMARDKFVTAKDQVNLKRYYGAKVFRCPKLMCFYFHEGFTDKKTRDRHVAKHDRPWQCGEPDCTSADFGFDSKQNLDHHMLSFHPDMEMKAKFFKTDEPKPLVTRWSCGQCGKSFARNTILKDHQLVHTGQKPHECSRCGKAFTRKYDCTRHEKIHETRRS